MTVINNNYKPAFKATLSLDLEESPRWKNIKRLYEKKTSDIKKYELMVYKTDNDSFMLSNYNEKTSSQTFNELSKKGMENLLKNDDNIVAEKLAMFTKTMFNVENKTAQLKEEFWKLMSKSHVDEYSADSIYSSYADSMSSAQMKLATDKINKDITFKNNIKIDV